MKPWIVFAVVAAAAPAWADPAERCAAGVAFEKRGDLSRAALYLNGCDDASLPDELADDVTRAGRELHKKLDASELSVLEIVSKPAGLDGEIDALPGEHFTTPATIYVPAGTHVVRAGAVTNHVETKPHARSVVYLDAGVPPTPQQPRTGKVDFREDTGGEPTAETAPPPDQKHPSLIGCKYSNSCTDAGEQIDDPLARRISPPPKYPGHALELRVGGTYEGGLQPSLGLAWTLMAPWEPRGATHPWVFWLHGQGTHGRRISASSIAAFGKVLVATDTAWLATGAGPEFDSYDGPSFAAFVDLSLRRLPITIGAHYDQGLERAMDGALPHVITVELGYRLLDH